ncbi:hypothetical protein GYMLUDRAFT_325601 [Collybiopsis luxurians FD-317 M1]|nr:hypothetical protein GYMLUDRAFT_325601 [Collybiopsis luxurians FD-317 M1]
MTNSFSFPLVISFWQTHSASRILIRPRTLLSLLGSGSTSNSVECIKGDELASRAWNSNTSASRNHYAASHLRGQCVCMHLFNSFRFDRPCQEMFPVILLALIFPFISTGGLPYGDLRTLR